jgi:hypothetical protein
MDELEKEISRLKSKIESLDSQIKSSETHKKHIEAAGYSERNHVLVDRYRRDLDKAKSELRNLEYKKLIRQLRSRQQEPLEITARRCERSDEKCNMYQRVINGTGNRNDYVHVASGISHPIPHWFGVAKRSPTRRSSPSRRQVQIERSYSR